MSRWAWSQIDHSGSEQKRRDSLEQVVLNYADAIQKYGSIQSLLHRCCPNQARGLNPHEMILLLEVRQTPAAGRAPPLKLARFEGCDCAPDPTEDAFEESATAGPLQSSQTGITMIICQQDD